MNVRLLSAAVALFALTSTAPLPAAIEVELNGLTDEQRRNVEAHLELGKPLPEPPPDEAAETPVEEDDEDALADTAAPTGKVTLEPTEAQVRRMYGRAERQIRKALRPFGYYLVQVRSELLRTDDGWRATFDIDPGRPVLLTELDIRISGEGRNDPPFVALVDEPDMVIGEPVRHDHYDALKSRLLELAAERGYFEAQLTRHELTIDLARRIASAHLHLDTGPRYRIGTVRIEQDFLDDDVVERRVKLKEGEFYDARTLRDTEFALYDLGHFSVVDIDTPPDEATRTTPATIRLTQTRKHRWTVGGGYSTDTNLYLRAGWENRLVNRRGHRMGVNLRLSEPKQDLLYRYVIPYQKRGEFLTILTGFIHETRGDTESYRFEIAPIDTRFWGKWQRDVFAIVQAENSDIAEFSFDDVLLIPGLRTVRTNWNNPAQPTRGYTLANEVRGSSTAVGAGTDYAQLRIRSAGYIPASRVVRFYLRGEIGITGVDDFNLLPASQRFFAGGDRSVRGFELYELSPVNPEGKKVGGKHLLFASVELEYDLLPTWTLDAFVDAGNAFDSFGDPLEYSVGVGFRWRSPLGLIGLDIAQPLSEDGRGPRLHLSIRPEL
ncbi:MAG: outer membrane protein assembly factor [Pseudomonadota bacterium]|nr:MAG: outer membrane protein assembly factor [Pseudomonadota bacterium]